MEKKRVLITGATGAVAAHLNVLLPRDQYDVVGLTSDQKKLPILEERGMIPVVGKMGDPSFGRAIQEAIAGCDAVFHLAAWMGIARRSHEAHEQNVVGTQMLVNAAQNTQVQKFIDLSTIGVYGPLWEEATEKKLPNAKDSYGRTKSEAEEIIRKSGINHTIFRAGPVIGREIPMWSGLAYDRIKNRKPIQMGDGGGRFNFTPVGDLVKAMVTSLSHEGARNQTFNVVGDQEEDRPILWSDFFGYYKRMLGIAPVYTPALLGLAAGYVFTGFSNITGREVPITAESIRMLGALGLVSNNKIKRELGIDFTPFDEAMRGSLAQFPEYK